MQKICNRKCANEIKEDFEEQEHKAKKEKRINQVKQREKKKEIFSERKKKHKK